MQLPGEYQTPHGALLLALGARSVAGVVALRRVAITDAPGAFEIKRLYVRPDARGQGAGRALVEAVLAQARKLGAQVAVLETLAVMPEALALYAGLGFERCATYRPDADDTVITMRLALARR